MFAVHSVDDGRTLPIEYMPAGAGLVPQIGLALAVDDGVLTVCATGTEPQYICMGEKPEACAEGETIPVARIQNDIVFETQADGEVAVGQMLSVLNGKSVTTGSEGNFEVVWIGDNNVVRGRFVA